MVHGKFLKKFEKSKIQFNINQKLNGKRVGNNFDLSFESLATNKFNYKLNFNSIQSHPGLIYDIYQSDYDNISFNNNHKLSDIKSLDLKLYYEKFGNLNIGYSNITNHFYLTVDSSQQNKLKPFINQYDGNINYLKIRYNKEFKFGIFSLDNSIIFQMSNKMSK